jgi:hypothetical protein
VTGLPPYAGPERRRFYRSMLLSDADVRLLVLAEHGYTYRPENAAEGSPRLDGAPWTRTGASGRGHEEL